MTKSNDDTQAPGSPKSVNFHYVKSSLFRTIHVDGIYGGMGPRGKLQMNLFSERTPIPKSINYEVSGEGIGKEVSRDTREGFVREVETHLILDFDVAVSVHAWLGRRSSRSRTKRPYFKRRTKRMHHDATRIEGVGLASALVLAGLLTAVDSTPAQGAWVITNVLSRAGSTPTVVDANVDLSSSNASRSQLSMRSKSIALMVDRALGGQIEPDADAFAALVRVAEAGSRAVEIAGRTHGPLPEDF